MIDIVPEARTLLAIASEIQAIAQIGLAYGKDNFDRERYQQLTEIAAELFSSKLDAGTVSAQFLSESGYASPKVDVRAVICKNDELLLVQEAQDGKWALPGGWADVNFSPSEAIIKEVFEETGLTCKTNRLLTLWDTSRHDHPPHWPYIYKCVFECEVIGGTFTANHEILDVKYFAVDKLPVLSTYRITRNQIDELMSLLTSKTGYTVFD